MKLAFICSSAEPGRDGVGDYTRRLAAACAEQGHRCLILALNDRHLTSSATELESKSRIVYRWSASLPWWVRMAAARDRIARFSPDWVSWQIVSYGFHPKGILPPELLQLALELRAPGIHVMLHELWIGIAHTDSWWTRALGWWQRRAVLKFLHAANPDELHTSNPTYVAALAQQGWRTDILPLFSNIPVAPSSADEIAATLAKHLPPAQDGHPRLMGVTFGTLHRQWEPEPTADLLCETAARQGKEPVVLALGRTGGSGPEILERLRHAGVSVVATGELPPAEVSQLMQAADLGIAPHPRALIAKSGVVAAMLDHGLPILMPRDDWRLRVGETPTGTLDPRLARLADLTPENVEGWLQRRNPPGDSFPATVANFLTQLSR